MPRYNVTVEFKQTKTKTLEVWATDDFAAEEKAVEIVLKWDGVTDAEATEVDKIES